MMWLLVAGFVGGVMRAFAGFMKHAEGRVEIKFFLSTLIFEGIIGMLFASFFLYTNLIHSVVTTGRLIALGLVAYVGADMVNSLYMICFKKRLYL